MSNIDDIITSIIKAEGGSAVTNDPVDAGGRTQYGISEAANPDAWADGSVSEEEARAIYRKKYFDGPGFSKLDDPRLQHLMCDFAVNSGPDPAIRSLQRVVGADVDGKLGPQTLARITDHEPRAVVNGVVIERLKLIGRIIANNKSQARFVAGWINRCVEFFIV